MLCRLVFDSINVCVSMVAVLHVSVCVYKVIGSRSFFVSAVIQRNLLKLHAIYTRRLFFIHSVNNEKGAKKRIYLKSQKDGSHRNTRIASQ